MVRLWDPSSGKHVRDIETGFSSGVYALALRPDARVIATAQELGPIDVDLWDVATGRLLQKLRGHTAMVKCLAFAPDGRSLASAGEDQTIRIWDSADGRPIAVLEGHADSVDAIAFTPDSKWLASQGLDATVRIWNLASGRVNRVHQGVPRKRTHTYSSSLAFSPEGRLLAAARSDSSVSLWDEETGHEVLTLSGHGAAVNAVAFLGDRRIVTTSDDRTIKLWDVATGEVLLTLRGHSGAVLGLACRPDGTQLATTGIDGARIWDTVGPSAIPRPGAGVTVATATAPVAAMKPSAIPRRESRLVLSGHSAQVNRIAYAPDGRTLATASDDRSVRLWEIESLQSRQLRGHTAPVVALAIGPDGRTIASGSGDWRNPKQPGELKLWDAVSGASVADLKGHAGPVFSVAFSPDGKTLASGSADGLDKLWDLAKACRARQARLRYRGVGPRPGVHPGRQDPGLGALGYGEALGPRHEETCHRPEGPLRGDQRSCDQSRRCDAGDGEPRPDGGSLGPGFMSKTCDPQQGEGLGHRRRFLS